MFLLASLVSTHNQPFVFCQVAGSTEQLDLNNKSSEFFIKTSWPLNGSEAGGEPVTKLTTV